MFCVHTRLSEGDSHGGVWVSKSVNNNNKICVIQSKKQPWAARRRQKNRLCKRTWPWYYWSLHWAKFTNQKSIFVSVKSDFCFLGCSNNIRDDISVSVKCLLHLKGQLGLFEAGLYEELIHIVRQFVHLNQAFKTRNCYISIQHLLCTSKWINMTYGVPQGAVFGLLLFSL